MGEEEDGSGNKNEDESGVWAKIKMEVETRTKMGTEHEDAFDCLLSETSVLFKTP